MRVYPRGLSLDFLSLAVPPVGTFVRIGFAIDIGPSLICDPRQATFPF